MNPKGGLALIVTLLLMGACAEDREVLIATATPNIEATVQAAVAAAIPTPTPTPLPDLDATVSAGIAATLAAIPTPTPTATPVPTATPTPTPTTTPTPEPTSTPIPTPTPTLWPTPTVTPHPTPTPRPTSTPRPTPTPTPPPAALLSEMVRQARPAVVRIETASGGGTGVIFETRGQTGYAITNHHVVDGAAWVNVYVNDATAYNGAVRGVDPVRDLAVVTICCGSFHALSFGDASRLEPGDEVVAIGYALGLSGQATITRGIVSALRYDSSYRSDVIQTDAAINPGNSGGPMLSLSGEILGINTFKISETRVEGLGFAISETTVQRQVPALRDGSLQPTPTPRARATPTPQASGQHDFGPTSGELRHDPAAGFIKTEYADVSIADMVVEATFVNPYSAASNSWDYGFFLRDRRGEPFAQVVVDSYGGWALMDGADAPYNQVGGGTLNRFNTSAGGRNHLRVVAIRERGWLFVNDEFVSTLDLSAVTRAGDVALITGAYEGNEQAGAVTRYEGFRGSRLSKQYGPADGQFQKEPGKIAEHGSGVGTRDLVAEAEFINPRGSDWDYGFIVRNPVFNRLDVIGVTYDGWWFHYTHDVGDEGYTTVAEGWLYEAGVVFQSRNRLLLLAFGESGWLYLNDHLVAKLDLSHNMEHGQISALGDFFLDHDGSPRFEDFNVWAP